MEISGGVVLGYVASHGNDMEVATLQRCFRISIAFQQRILQLSGNMYPSAQNAYELITGISCH